MEYPPEMKSRDPNLAAVEENFKKRTVESWVRRKKWPKRAPLSNYASQAGHPCKFFHYAKWVHWEEMDNAWDDEFYGILLTGDEMEGSIEQDMREAGLKITAQQVMFEEKKTKLRGYVDCFVQDVGNGIVPDPMPGEIKGMNQNGFAAATSFEALLDAPRKWLRNYPAQILLYGTMPSGYFKQKQPPSHVCMIVREKSSRETRYIIDEVARWTWYVEEIRKRMRSVNLAVSKKRPPKPIKYDTVWCNNCPAAALCPTMRSLKFEGNLLEVDSPDLDELLSVLDDHALAKKKHAAADRKVKAWLEKQKVWEGEIGLEKTIVSAGFMIETVIGSRATRIGEDTRPSEPGPQKNWSFKRLGEGDG